MNWPLRALAGPTLWAAAFAVIYAVHGAACAQGWEARPALIGLWLIAVALGVVLVLRAPPGGALPDMLVRAGAWIGVASVLLTLFPVLGLTTCTDIPLTLP